MSNLIERAVNNAEESNEIARKCIDEQLPGFFYLGMILGSNGKAKNIEKWLKNETVKELFEKGQKIVQTKFQTKTICNNCKKEFEPIKDMKFCPFCARTVSVTTT